MKKVLFFAAAVAAMMLASCKPSEYEVVVNDPADANLVTITITANLDQATKATINDAEKKWVWSEGDHLAVFDGVAKRDFTLTAGAGTSIATFTGSIDPGAGALDAIFPYAAAAGDDFAAGYVIPAAQTVTAEAVVDPNALVATATGAKDGDDYNFTFTSAVSFIRFTSAAADKFIFHAVDKEDSLTGDGRAVVVNAPAAGTWWVAVKPASYTGIRVFRRVAGHDYMLSSAATLDLSTPGKAKEFGTISSTANEVKVIETADELIAYLGGSPTLDAYVVDDLDLTAKSVTTCASYALNFDGQYHKIKNWTSNGVALFGANTGTISNITLDASCNLTLPTTMDGYFGFIVKQTTGDLTGLVNYASTNTTASITAASRVGMIAGWSSNAITVSNCENHGNMHLTLTSGSATSMFAGVMCQLGNKAASIVDCKNIGDVTVDLDVAWSGMCNLYVGGVTAQSSSNASNIRLRNEGDITLNAKHGIAHGICVGGCTSYTTGNITDCYNSGNVSFISKGGICASLVGGVTGYFAGASKTMSGSYNYGNVTIEAEYQAGYNNMGDISSGSSGTATYKCGAIVGGLAGATASKTLTFNTSENHGNVSLTFTDPINAGVGIVTSGRPTIGGCVGDNWGTVDGLKNYGEVSASLVSGGSGTESFTASNAGYTTYIGGIVGAGYLVKDQISSSITNCENHGAVHLHSLNTQANHTNHAVGGIVGWPGKESGNSNTVTNCTNDATVKVSGTINVRVGGISGGSIGISSCSNSGTVKLEGTTLYSTCSLGGIVGYQGSTYILQNCNNTGNVVSETVITSVTVDETTTYGGVGGIIGLLGNATNPNRYGGSVNCAVNVPDGVDEVGMLVGHYNGTGNSPMGTEENKIAVGGSLTKGAVTTTMTAGTLTRTYLFGAHTNADAQEFHVTLFGS